MTYKRQPDVTYQCQVILWKTGKRCSRDANALHGKVSMCSQHHAQFVSRLEEERLRLKDKYARETA